ncbi:MAG: hypothetical protein IKN55_00825, partial [Oscillospiraceae bacterium]|nr:hypothetical protein [Oscillospiraceae bacterium]
MNIKIEDPLFSGPSGYVIKNEQGQQIYSTHRKFLSKDLVITTMQGQQVAIVRKLRRNMHAILINGQEIAVVRKEWGKFIIEKLNWYIPVGIGDTIFYVNDSQGKELATLNQLYDSSGDYQVTLNDDLDPLLIICITLAV